MSSPTASTPPETARSTVDETYRKVYDRVADAIIIHDKKTHRILDANLAAKRRYGYTIEEFREMTPFDLHPDEDHGTVEEKISERNPDVANVYVHIDKHGQRYDVEILSDEVTYHGNEAWLSIVRDITDRQKVAQELSEARDRALAASQHKSDYVAGISHELRTPMNGVIGMAALLLETELTAEQGEFVSTIMTAGEGMLELLNELLDLSKIEAGRLELETTPFDLQQCLADVQKILRARAQTAGLELLLDIDSDVESRVLGDPVRLRQIVINLAGNAIKFTKSGHVAIRVKRCGGTDTHTRLCFAVEDTGIGIPADKLDTIFDEFSQADSATYRQFGGTGLGLSISRRLVELMGGKIRVESSLQRGSTFSFEVEFPFDVDQSDVDIGSSVASKRGVLIVHGDEQRRLFLRDQIERWGLEAMALSSSTEVLEMINSGRWESNLEVAILDYELPDLDGESLGRAIRSTHGSDTLKMFLITPKDWNLPFQRLESAGFDGALPSPIDPEDLKPHLEELMTPEETTEMHLNPSAPTPSSGDSSYFTPQVLVVEDNLVNQRVVLHMLAKLGCEANVAEHGERALDMIHERGYDMILMDCQMPKMDGYEATRRIRELADSKSSIPIVALTANAMAGDREKCIDAGMDDYLSKPASTDQLRATLQKWVAGYEK